MHTPTHRALSPIVNRDGGGRSMSADTAATQQRLLLRATASDLNEIGVRMLRLHRGAGKVAPPAGDGTGDNGDSPDDEDALLAFQGAFSALVATMPQGEGGDDDVGEGGCGSDGPSSSSPQSAGAAAATAGTREDAIRRGAEQVALGWGRLAATEAEATSRGTATNATATPPPSYRQSPSCVSSSPEDMMDATMEASEDGKRCQERQQQGAGEDGMPRTRLLSTPLRIEPHPPPRDGDCEDYSRDRHNLAAIVYNMGLVYCGREAHHTAEQLFEMALETAPDPDPECGDDATATSTTGSTTTTGTDFLAVLYLSLNNLGYIRYCLGKHEEATKHFSDALRLVQRVCNHFEVRQAGSREDEGAERKDQQPKGAADIDTSSSPPERCAARRHLSAIMTNNALSLFAVGEACEQRGMLDAAMLVYVGIVRARRAQPLPGLPEDPCSSMVYSLVLFRMGNIHYLRGEKDKAVQAFEFALTLRRQALGNDHEVVAALVHDLGVVQLECDRTGEAMECFAECLRIRRALLGDDHREVAEVLYRIGRINQDVGNYEEALDAYKEAVRIERATLGPDHPDVAITVTNIGQVHYLQGDLGPALEAYGEVLRMVRRTMGECHPSIVEIQGTIGTIHLNLGNSRDAMAAFEEARRVEREAAAAGLLPPGSGTAGRHRDGTAGHPSMEVDVDRDDDGRNDRPNFPGASAA